MLQGAFRTGRRGEFDQPNIAAILETTAPEDDEGRHPYPPMTPPSLLTGGDTACHGWRGDRRALPAGSDVPEACRQLLHSSSPNGTMVLSPLTEKPCQPSGLNSRPTGNQFEKSRRAAVPVSDFMLRQGRYLLTTYNR